MIKHYTAKQYKNTESERREARISYSFRGQSNPNLKREQTEVPIKLINHIISLSKLKPKQADAIYEIKVTQRETN